MTTTTTAPSKLLATLAEIRTMRETLARLTEHDPEGHPNYWPEPDAITETMRLRFSAHTTAVVDYHTGRRVPMDPDTVTPDMSKVCPVIELPRGVCYYIRRPYVALTRDTHAQIVAYIEVWRNETRYSGSLIAPLTPEAMPGNGQAPRPYWDNYPHAYNPGRVDLPPGARDAVAASVATLIPEPLPPVAILAARLNALHREAAGELSNGLHKAARALDEAIRNAARYATAAGTLAEAH